MSNSRSTIKSDELKKSEQLFILDDLLDFDMGTFTMKILSRTDRLYKIKNDRVSTMMDSMLKYRQQGLFCDVVLCVAGYRFPAHKLVLSSSSAYFESMFGQPGHIEAQTNGEIDLTKIIPCPRAMETILDFIYTSQVKLNDKCVLPVLTFSMALLLDDLIEVCISYLCEQLHPSNSVGLLLYARKFQILKLVNVAQQYIFEHFEEVVRQEEFLSLTFHELCSMIKNDKLKVTCESIVYNAAMQWVRHDPSNRRKELCDILPCIRLHFLDPLFLKGVMDEEDFAQSDMEHCREYIEHEIQKLESHRYRILAPHREPIKPLVIYCAGGYCNESINTLECYFTETQEWKSCARFRTPRSGVGVVSFQMRVYVIGGRQNIRNENQDCSDVERYDPFKNQWTTIASMNSPRNRLGVGTIDQCIYAVGGSCGQQILSSVECYSLRSESKGWMIISPMIIARIGLAVCSHSRLLYAIGGYDGQRRLNEVECYNPDTNTWKLIPSLIFGRSGAAVTSLAEYIFVLGGFASSPVDGSMQLNSVERYDTLAEQWTLVTPMSSPRSALSCVTLNNRIYALGGYDGQDFLDKVEIYNPEKDEWYSGKSLTSKRSGHGSALTVEPTLHNDE